MEETASLTPYRLISSDSHIFEPPDLWENRIDPMFRDRAPYVAREEDTDQWYADGNIKFGSFTNTQAGIRFEAPEKISSAGRYEDVRKGGFDPHAHVQDMDVDGVTGGVLYPSSGLSLFKVPDGALLSAIFRAYNDWLADFCKPYPERLKGIAMLNVDSIKDAVDELERTAALGLAGAMIALSPMRERYDDSAYDSLWAAAQETKMPLSLHTGTFRWKPDGYQLDVQNSEPAEMTNREYHVRNSLAYMIFSGVFERYPGLKVGAVEFEITWAPYFISRMDNTYKERTAGQGIPRFKNGLMPSDFFHSNVFISFQEDDAGILLRSYLGEDTLLWGSDYPHAESTFPRSREIVNRILMGVPDEEKSRIVGGNAAKVYHFN